MSNLDLLTVAHTRTRWLAARTAALSANIANADTPGYKARDVVSFEEYMKSGELRRPQSSQNGQGGAGLGQGDVGMVPRNGNDKESSGNEVSLQRELAELGESRGQHSAVVAITISFQRLLALSVKG